MRDKRWMLIMSSTHVIYSPEFFKTYDEAYEKMKRQYEFLSMDCIGEISKDDAWCKMGDCMNQWRIFYIE